MTTPIPIDRDKLVGVLQDRRASFDNAATSSNTPAAWKAQALTDVLDDIRRGLFDVHPRAAGIVDAAFAEQADVDALAGADQLSIQGVLYRRLGSPLVDGPGQDPLDAAADRIIQGDVEKTVQQLTVGDVSAVGAILAQRERESEGMMARIMQSREEYAKTVREAIEPAEKRMEREQAVNLLERGVRYNETGR